ncbi:Protein CBG14034 [Caenorhabditis briggsae]|uniref:Protein CBG14034 n=1 Tax=Caenorhabditis briggsae TaxID=6238 RepID=A8XJ80_CAEBR|nr:Protein CBG14034 [Caenorhabditis briggsae]CAP32705.2 Protein CBG14034 [Caenorhabditis briggsae]
MLIEVAIPVHFPHFNDRLRDVLDRKIIDHLKRSLDLKKLEESNAGSFLSFEGTIEAYEKLIEGLTELSAAVFDREIEGNEDLEGNDIPMGRIFGNSDGFLTHKDRHFLLPSYIPNGTILNERFVIERQLGAWYGERCYHGRDSQNNKQIVLKAFLPADPRIQAYVDFFKECSGMQGIPTFLAHFSSYESEFIAHEYNGVLLRGILNARMFHISLENTIRLGYRLFKILHAIHLKGYVHKNIQPLSITCDVGPDGELVVNLTYFGHAALIDEPPSNNKIILGPYQSLHVSRGGAYSRIDDYISVVLVMLSCQTINPFDFNINRDLTHVQKNDNFHANPYAVLTPQTMWLGDLYLQLEEMRADRLSHLQVMAALRRAVPGFDPQTAITYPNDVESVYHLID